MRPPFISRLILTPSRRSNATIGSYPLIQAFGNAQEEEERHRFLSHEGTRKEARGPILGGVVA
jgi:hypothetical protein